MTIGWMVLEITAHENLILFYVNILWQLISNSLLSIFIVPVNNNKIKVILHTYEIVYYK